MIILYHGADIFFFLFHTVLIAFNLLGWIWPRTRKLNLLTLSLTALSWFGLGYWYGFGYCPLTEWHWEIRQRLGDTDLPLSYVKFLIDHLAGLDVNAAFADGLAVACFALACAASLTVNARDWRRRRRQARE